jgi:hypothetical protein
MGTRVTRLLRQAKNTVGNDANVRSRAKFVRSTRDERTPSSGKTRGGLWGWDQGRVVNAEESLKLEVDNPGTLEPSKKRMASSKDSNSAN